MELILTYQNDEPTLSYEEFWEEEEKIFDNTNKTHVYFMMQAIKKIRGLDKYAIRKLEATIKTELPFFAKTRALAKSWILREFIC